MALSVGLLFLGGDWLWGLLATLPLVALGTFDHFQTRHSLLRNYPIIGHLRFLIEGTGAELRQYIVESNTEGRPFNRDMRSLIYQRAKNVSDKKAFGTELDVYEAGYGWLAATPITYTGCFARSRARSSLVTMKAAAPSVSRQQSKRR